MNQTSDVRAMMDVVNDAATWTYKADDYLAHVQERMVKEERRRSLLILADALEDAGNDTLAVRLRMVAEAGLWPRLNSYNGHRYWSFLAEDDNPLDYTIPDMAHQAMQEAFIDGRNGNLAFWRSPSDALIALANALVPFAEDYCRSALDLTGATVS